MSFLLLASTKLAALALWVGVDMPSASDNEDVVEAVPNDLYSSSVSMSSKLNESSGFCIFLGLFWRNTTGGGNAVAVVLVATAWHRSRGLWSVRGGRGGARASVGKFRPVVFSGKKIREWTKIKPRWERVQMGFVCDLTTVQSHMVYLVSLY